MVKQRLRQYRRGVCAGTVVWHGKELRRYRRLMSPPLQQLLTSQGTAVLGRGVASAPEEYARQAGLQGTLMHLASDAVRAAAESPFLESAAGRTSAILCCLCLPPEAAVALGAALPHLLSTPLPAWEGGTVVQVETPTPASLRQKSFLDPTVFKGVLHQWSRDSVFKGVLHH